MIVVMFLVVTIVFVILRVTPGDPAAVMLGPDASAQDIAELRGRLGLDQSLGVSIIPADPELRRSPAFVEWRNE